MKLSIIVPVYNEEKTLTTIIDKVQKVKLDNIKKEVIIINDCSTDNSQKVIDGLKKQYNNIISINHDKNKGKGAAIRTGFQHFTGDVVVIQDGDLEYNPEDFIKMIDFIKKGEKVVYGSRLLGHVTGFNIPSHYYGNKLLSFMTALLYNHKVTDMETCYKMMTKEVISSIKLKSNKFDIEPEITAKLLKKGYKIAEIPIDYNCRTFEEGKKITWKDGISAINTLIKYRFSD